RRFRDDRGATRRSLREGDVGPSSGDLSNSFHRPRGQLVEVGLISRNESRKNHAVLEQASPPTCWIVLDAAKHFRDLAGIFGSAPQRSRTLTAAPGGKID